MTLGFWDNNLVVRQREKSWCIHIEHIAAGFQRTTNGSVGSQPPPQRVTRYKVELSASDQSATRIYYDFK